MSSYTGLIRSGLKERYEGGRGTMGPHTKGETKEELLHRAHQERG
jgi:hypothetical protein